MASSASRCAQPSSRDEGEAVLLDALQSLHAQDLPTSRFKTIRATMRIVWGLRGVPGYAGSALAFLQRQHHGQRPATADNRATPVFDVTRVWNHWSRHPWDSLTSARDRRDRAITALATSTAAARQAESLRVRLDAAVSLVDRDGRPGDPIDIEMGLLACALPANAHALFFYTEDKGVLLRRDGKRVPLVVLCLEDAARTPAVTLWAWLRERRQATRGASPTRLHDHLLFPHPDGDHVPLAPNTVPFCLRRALTAVGLNVNVGDDTLPSDTRKASFNYSRRRFGKDIAEALGRWSPGSNVPTKHYAREMWRGIASLSRSSGGGSTFPSTSPGTEDNNSDPTKPGGVLSPFQAGIIGGHASRGNTASDDDGDPSDGSDSGASGPGPVLPRA